MSTPATILQNYKLDHANTMALACTAKKVVQFTEESQIIDFLQQRAQQIADNDISCDNLFVLSGGSNVLLPNQLNACVLQPKLTGIKLLIEDTDYAYVQVMAGENWHEWVLTSIENGWYGLENMALIPGLVGASPVQNIGAYGVELCDFFEELTAINLATAEEKTFSKDACQFAYRDSFFKQHPNEWLITKVVFKLHKQPKLNLNYGDVASLATDIAKQAGEDSPMPTHVASAIIQIRNSKLPNPAEIANTGSFFKNPVVSSEVFAPIQTAFPSAPHYPLDNGQIKVPAGWLIDNAGFKGHQIGNIATHTKQALVVVNHAPNVSKQSDIETFCDFIKTNIYKKYGIMLEREPVWVTETGTTC